LSKEGESFAAQPEDWAKVVSLICSMQSVNHYLFDDAMGNGERHASLDDEEQDTLGFV
jgi:hypothetical protein